ncbi:MAG: hypothetical protein ISS34_05840 [Candidatus Omnitrophica bacterium]|nr:hypothetical protein [Candidatus Omnitrophota bacterium]
MKKKVPKMTPEHDFTRKQNVLLEKVYQEVKTIGEGHNSIRQEIKQLKGSMENRLDTIEMAVMENSRKIDRVEKKLDTVTTDHKTRLQKLETVR